MSLITSVCSGGMTFHGLSFVHSICRPPSLLTSIKALTVAFPTINPRHRLLRRSPFDSAIRALASAAVSTASPVSQEGKVSAKAQWKAAIDFKWIRDNKDVIAANIMNRNSNANLNVVLDLYEKFLNLQKEVERLRAERNIVAEKMRGKMEASVRQALVQEGKNLKEKLASLEEDLVHLTDQLQQEAQCIPNITHPNVPIGGEESSVIRKTVGSPRELTFNIKDHLELGKELDLFDFDAAAEVSGSKFYYLKNEAVLLEMALINWAIAEVSKQGFKPLITPEIVRSSVVEKCGFQPRGQNTQENDYPNYQTHLMQFDSSQLCSLDPNL